MTQKQKLENEVKRIADILIKEYNPIKIVLFGSLASGKVHEWSDIDIAVVKETDKRIYDRIGEVISLCKSREAVDFKVYTPEEFEEMQRIEPFVQEEIVNKGKVLYEAA